MLSLQNMNRFWLLGGHAAVFFVCLPIVQNEKSSARRIHWLMRWCAARGRGQAAALRHDATEFVSHTSAASF
jgi:hypothetical protein